MNRIEWYVAYTPYIVLSSSYYKLYPSLHILCRQAYYIRCPYCCQLEGNNKNLGLLVDSGNNNKENVSGDKNKEDEVVTTSADDNNSSSSSNTGATTLTKGISVASLNYSVGK